MRGHHIVGEGLAKGVRKSNSVAVEGYVLIQVTSGEEVVGIHGVALSTEHYELVAPVSASQVFALMEFWSEVDLDVELSNPAKRSLQVEFLSDIGDLESEVLVEEVEQKVRVVIVLYVGYALVVLRVGERQFSEPLEGLGDLEVGGGKGAGHVKHSDLGCDGWGYVMAVDLYEVGLVEVDGIVGGK